MINKFFLPISSETYDRFSVAATVPPGLLDEAGTALKGTAPVTIMTNFKGKYKLLRRKE